jgi:hypothetical protein
VADTLRGALYVTEGQAATDDAIRRGLRVWAVERTRAYMPRQTALVFGRSRSDAIRRAGSPARMGEEIDGDLTTAVEVPAEWDAPARWPAVRPTSELYRDGDGHEVWRILGADGSVESDGVASDHDAEWILGQARERYAADL